MVRGSNDPISASDPASAEAIADRLSSWKKIARYLGRDVRTAMRWEKEAGLPVHRVGGHRGSSVFAYRGEIDAWLRAQASVSGTLPEETVDAPPARPFALKRILLPAALLALITLAGALGANGPSRRVAGLDAAAPVSVHGGRTVLRAMGDDGSVVWEYAHPDGATWERTPRVVRFPGPRGSRYGAVVVAANAVGGNLPLDEGRLIRFAPDGTPLWSVTAAFEFDFQDWRMGPPWSSAAAEPATIGESGRILWALNHNVWWPSILVAVDPDGAQQLRFVNAGWITAIATRPAEGELLLGGINNARAGAMVALLPLDGPAASSPEEASSSYACAACPPARPLRYVVLPPSDVSVADGQPYNRVSALSITEDGVRVVVQESANRPDAVRIWSLSRDLRVLRVDVSDAFWVEHRRLGELGALDHDESVCPERQGPAPVVAWSPDGGWEQN